MGCIYGHRNKITGDEYYIGQTSVNYEFANVYRWKNGAGYTYSNTYFGNIVKQVGWENIEHFCIADNIDSQEELDRLEIENIKKYRSYIGFEDCKGYNMTLGGKNTVTGLEWSEEEKILLILNYPILGPVCFKLFKNRTERAIRSMAKCLGLKMINRPTGNFYTEVELKIMYDFYPTEGTKVVKRLPGRTEKAIKRLARVLGIKCNFAKVPTIKWTEENKNRLRELYPLMGTKCCEILNCSPNAVAQMASKLGLTFNHIPTNCHRIICWELKKEYSSITEAVKAFNLKTNSGISVAIDKPNKTATGYHWCSTTNFLDFNPIILPKIKCIELNIVFNKAADAARYIKQLNPDIFITSSTIHRCCQGKQALSGNYHWKYID